jgi:2'-5' RNA ligase
VELLCDPRLEEEVRTAWDRLAAAGLPSLARNRHSTNRPHLTLAAVEEFPPGAQERLTRLCREALPVPVRLDRITVLDGSAPLVWLLAPSAALTALHRAVWAELGQAPGRLPWHEPGRWVPHLSLALRFRDADRRLARAVAGARRPTGELVAARSYDGSSRAVTGLGGDDPAAGRGALHRPLSG